MTKKAYEDDYNNHMIKTHVDQDNVEAKTSAHDEKQF